MLTARRKRDMARGRNKTGSLLFTTVALPKSKSCLSRNDKGLLMRSSVTLHSWSTEWSEEMKYGLGTLRYGNGHGSGCARIGLHQCREASGVRCNSSQQPGISAADRQDGRRYAGGCDDRGAQARGRR